MNKNITVRGIQKQWLDVEISERDLIDAVITLINRKYPDQNSEDFIDSKGMYNRYDGRDYHKGDPEFTILREATNTDRVVMSVFKFLNDLKSL